ncbi:MAG: pitrilysin family protein [Pseudomonadota bacterium]|nr:pitrilysin family protein [Pseudomonadota bacterium]
MTTKYKLQNGLTVLLIESHKAPVVSVQAWVKTGSADEVKGQEGISHFIEHLVFKGTKSFKVGEIAKTIEGSGGELNAYTSFDQTVYYVTISKQFSEIGLQAISEMIGFPTFDQAEIDNERGVVLEEIKRSLDSAHSQASWQMFKNSYQKHPYGIPVIGYEKIIKNVTRKTLQKYFSERYSPPNMLLVVTGNFESKKMKADIKKYFGKIKKTKVSRVNRKKEPPQKKARVFVGQSTFEENFVYLAWKIPNIKHKDVVALDLLAMILGEGESSRLFTKLRLEEPLVRYVGASTFAHKDPGLFFVVASLPSTSIERYFQKLKDILESILDAEVKQDELSKAILQLETDEYYGLETVDGLAGKAGYLEFFMGNHNYYPKYLKQICGTDAKKILGVARKYLVPEALSLSVLLGKEAKTKKEFFEVWASGYKEMFKKASQAKSQSKSKPKAKKAKIKISAHSHSEPKIIEKTLRNGTRVVFRISRDTPVISARAAFLGGLRAEPIKAEGLTEMLSRVWTSGTKCFNEEEIIRKTEDIAGRLSAFGGRNTVGVSMSVLSPFEKEGAGLFANVLSEPNFPPEIIERERTILLDTIKTQNDEASHVAIQLFLDRMFSGHPYGRDSQGKTESVSEINREHLANHYQAMAMQKNLMVAVSGFVDPNKWVDALEKQLVPLPVGSEWKKEFQLKHLGDSTRHFQSLKKEQTHIVLGYRGLNMFDKRRYVLHVLQSILAGQGGRLFVELRDKASLAYSVSPIRFDGVDTGYFGTYIGCSPGKGAKAIGMMEIELKKIMEKAPAEVELARAKRYLIGRHDIDLQGNGAFASSILFNEIYGISRNEIFEFPDRINQVAASEVRDLASAIFGSSSVLVAVGSQCPW